MIQEDQKYKERTEVLGCSLQGRQAERFRNRLKANMLEPPEGWSRGSLLLLLYQQSHGYPQT